MGEFIFYCFRFCKKFKVIVSLGMSFVFVIWQIVIGFIFLGDKICVEVIFELVIFWDFGFGDF